MARNLYACIFFSLQYQCVKCVHMLYVVCASLCVFVLCAFMLGVNVCMLFEHRIIDNA